MSDYNEHLITQAGGGESPHATFCAGNHVMGESPCTDAAADAAHREAAYNEAYAPRVNVSIMVGDPYFDFRKAVNFTNVPLSVVEEAIAHINDNSDPLNS